MRMLKRVVFLLILCGPFIFTSCETSRVTSGGPYHVTAYKPNDPSKVVVKVSLSKQNVYVMEDDRSGSYGFRVQGNRVVPAEAGSNIAGRYVGYPMGFWCEFAPAYGFHQGFVHLAPRTHGCIRLKGEAAAKFYALVRIGTPVNIASTQPEDATIGPKVQRVDDSHTPDPDPHRMVTDAAFEAPSGPLLQ